MSAGKSLLSLQLFNDKKPYKTNKKLFELVVITFCRLLIECIYLREKTVIRIILVLLISVLMGCVGNRKQLKSCEDARGLKIQSFEDVPENYSGIALTCWENKVIKSCEFSDGNKNWGLRVWYRNGQLKNESNWESDKKSGLYKKWWHKRQLHDKGKFSILTKIENE